MKLFKCHAVMPPLGHEWMQTVRTYVVIAAAWQEARARVHDQEPGTEFVTVPVEVPNVLMIDVKAMSERELADLRSASDWNESKYAAEPASSGAAPEHAAD